MGRIAFVFAGQGAQFPGMGKQLYDSRAEARELFDSYEKEFPGLRSLCFEGSEDDLKKTEITQPCMYAVETAVYAVLTAEGVKAEAMAGFSLGEISALCASGAVSPEEGFRLVVSRGTAMSKAAAAHPAAMAAVVKLTAEQTEEICSGIAEAYPVNYNCPGQTVVSCAEDSLPALTAAVKAAGGRALPLKVSGGFHSPFMNDAAAEYGEALAAAGISAPKITLYSNVTGKPYPGDPGTVRTLLKDQITSPVRWEDTIRDMTAAGFDTFVEIGPGKTLCGLIGKIDPGLKTLQACGPDDIAEIINALG